ncbi:hypothetical protein SNE40_009713 [Patella caerulea]|uniref:Integrase core domain-containing protein n=1 Tax=Patella caerulea TaxID=87958 RepID=A0AAN8JP65_PATCE
MQELDASGLEERGGVGKPKRPRRERNFHSEGSDYTLSLDGHDKLCGYQKSTFPLCVYGGQDTYSGRIQFLKVSTSNNDPKIKGKFYLEYLYETRRLPIRLRVDRGTETGDMTTMHCYLIDKYIEVEDATDFVLYGPSTENKIERFWRDLHHRLEIYFKKQISGLLENGDYDPSNEKDRLLLAYVYIPIIQKELDIFRETVWNNHRCRRNNNKQLPTGIPEHLYFYPEKYGGVNCSLKVSDNDLNEVADLANIGEVKYLTDDFRDECMRHIDPTEICSNDADKAYLFLKTNFNPANVASS